MGNKGRPGYHGTETCSEKKDTLKKRGFYQCRAWRRARLLALQRDHYLCQACLKKGRITKATEVLPFILDGEIDKAMNKAN